MRIGYCCSFNPEDATWAKKSGFTTLEIGYMPGGKDEWKKAKEWFDANSFHPMSVFHYNDYGAPNKQDAEAAIAECYKAMEMCVALEVPVLALNGWAGHDGEPKDKIARFKKIFTPLVKKAADMGLKIAVENCPHDLHNVMWSPVMWEACFNEVPDEALGLEFDPSHLYWMGVDYVVALKKFVSRTYAFHAKDTELIRDVIAWEGNVCGRWWRYRIPGWGEIDWRKLFTILMENNYQGDITIEHEDPVFRGARYKEGLIKGLCFLRDLTGDNIVK